MTEAAEQPRPRAMVAHEVADALAAVGAVVALESTILAHGLPRGDNRRVADEIEVGGPVGGAVPATIAVVDGAVRIGLDAGRAGPAVRFRRLRQAVRPRPGRRRGPRAWTARPRWRRTSALAHRAGIAVFATGRHSRDRKEEMAVKEIGLSSLLVGTNAGGVSGRDSLLAVLEGVSNANEALAAAKRSVRIATVQFAELYLGRALLAIEDLGILVKHSPVREKLKAPKLIETRRGARRQIAFKEPEGWWDRLQVKGKPEPGKTDDGSLRFISLTQRARAEARVVATQRKLVDQFVRNTIRNTRHDRELTRTLFELLLPNELKEQAPDRRSLVIVLDDASARYPWELLENAYDTDAEPIAVSRGLLRQLETNVFREAPVRSLGNDVLVVGDPILPEDGPLKRLPGARDEASAVADQLERSRRFKVNRRIEASAREIVQAFFAHPYRMVHLAGHGVYEWEEPVKPADGTTAPSPAQRATQTVTGMVIGDGVYLTPGEVKQMRRVPELVFINCCHLGYVRRSRRARGGRSPAGSNAEAFAARRLPPVRRQRGNRVHPDGGEGSDRGRLGSGRRRRQNLCRELLRGDAPRGDIWKSRASRAQRHVYQALVCEYLGRLPVLWRSGFSHRRARRGRRGTRH